LIKGSVSICSKSAYGLIPWGYFEENSALMIRVREKQGSLILGHLKAAFFLDIIF